MPVVSFTFGLPAVGTISAFKRVGTTTIQTVTSVAEAVEAHAAGVVMPRALADFGLLPVPGAFGGTSTGVGAGRTLASFGVAVAGHEPLVAGMKQARAKGGTNIKTN